MYTYISAPGALANIRVFTATGEKISVIGSRKCPFSQINRDLSALLDSNKTPPDLAKLIILERSVAIEDRDIAAGKCAAMA